MSRIFFTKYGAKIAGEIEIREWEIAKVNAISVYETPLFQGLTHKYMQKSVHQTEDNLQISQSHSQPNPHAGTQQ